ncbi:MAG: vWA domain-containing protein [Candidatus Sumerlaeota bacterium]
MGEWIRQAGDFLNLMLEMEFERLWVLWLLVIPLGLMLWQWIRPGHHVALPFDHGQPRHARILGFLTSCADMLPPALLAIALLICAGPKRTGPPESERVLTNMLFCLDVSGSMNAQFGGQVIDGAESNTRYDGAMAAIHNFTTYRKGDAFGLTIFGNEVLHWVPVTKDLSAIRLATPFLRPGKLPPWFGGTSIGKALLKCKEQLVRHEEGDRAIILVTDGHSSDLSSGRDRQIATELKEAGIVTYVISVQDQAVHPSMHTIASVTDGGAFQAGDPESLNTIFMHIDQMQKARIKEGQPVQLDFFWPFTYAGLALLALLLLTMFGLRYTPW